MEKIEPGKYVELGYDLYKVNPDGTDTLVHQTDTEDPEKIVFGGYQAYLAKYPDLDIKIIVLENRNDRDRWQLATDIDKALGLR